MTNPRFKRRSIYLGAPTLTCRHTVDVVRALIVGRLCLYDGALENYRGAANLGPAWARRCSNSCTV